MASDRKLQFVGIQSDIFHELSRLRGMVDYISEEQFNALMEMLTVLDLDLGGFGK
mgnify:CR=1 FL=1